MKKLTNLILLFSLFIVTNCGYTPLFETKNLKYKLEEINLSGERSVNVHILNNLKKFQINEDVEISYNINGVSSFKKEVTNKDRNGNPKDYRIEVRTNIEIVSKDGERLIKEFIKTISYSAENKKIKEKEIEDKNIKDLSNEIAKDIIFFLKQL